MTKVSHRRFGNVRRLPSGRWQARWSGPDGYVHKAPDTFDTRPDAEAWLASQELAGATGRLVDERDAAVPLAVVVGQWEATRAHKRAATSVRDTGYVARYISPVFGALPVGQLTPSRLDAWVSDLRARGLAPATIRKAAQLLTSILELAVRDRRLADNPAKGIALPTVEEGPLLTLTPAEITRLADAIDPRYRALVIVGCYTGLRFAELTALTAGDVDLVRRRLTVIRNTVEVSGRLHHGPVKTKAGVRTVPLAGEALEALKPLVAGAHRDDLIFTAPAGGFLRRTSWVSRFWRPAVAAAGLEVITPHAMRHTAVSLWLAAGIDPKAIAAWAGHRSVVTVLDRYGHLQPDHADQFLARLDAMIATANSQSGQKNT
jgi:integrase